MHGVIDRAHARSK